MIDKKPFRVTNEQAKIEVMCASKPNCSGCELNPRTCCKGRGSPEDYAADLLDSRELIDKQEALIKEMREYIANMIEHNSDTIYITEGANILEKTKDYAL